MQARTARDTAARAGSIARTGGSDGFGMPRDIPVGNGQLLVTFDHQYQLRDLFFPHVGQENHAGGGPCRFGVFADVPGQNRSALSWTGGPGWRVRQRYLRDTLATSVSLEHDDLK